MVSVRIFSVMNHLAYVLIIVNHQINHKAYMYRKVSLVIANGGLIVPTKVHVGTHGKTCILTSPGETDGQRGDKCVRKYTALKLKRQLKSSCILTTSYLYVCVNYIFCVTFCLIRMHQIICEYVHVYV